MDSWAFGHLDEVDLSTWTLEELYHAQEELHIELAHELHLAGVEIAVSKDLAAVAFLFPVSILNKFIFSRCENRTFSLSPANYVDLAIFVLVIWWWDKFAIYSHRDLSFPLFGPEEDN